MDAKTKFCLVLIVALAIFFRFYNLKNVPPGLYPDEAMNGNNAIEALSVSPPAGGWKVFYPENNGREGLFMNIQSGFIYFLGNKPWVLRLPSAIFGTLTVLGIFFLSKLLFDARVALLASFFLATSFWHINFSRIGFRAIMAPFFLVWSLYFFFRFYKDIGSNFSQILSSMAGGILFGLGFHTYIAYRIAPLLFVVPIIIGWKDYKKDEKREACFPCLVALFFFFTFLTALPLGFYYLNNPADFLGRTAQISIFSEPSPLKAFFINSAKTLGMFWVYGDFNWRHNFSGMPMLFWPIGILFFIGIIISLKTFSNRALFLLSWAGLMFLPVVFSSEGLPHALRAIITIPPVMILSAWGGIFVINKLNDWVELQKNKYPQYQGQLARIKKELQVFLFVILGAITISTFNQYFLRWANNPNVYFAFSANYKEIGEWLKTLPPDLPKYVIVNAVGVEVRGIPMPAQTVMFITNTFLEEDRKDKNMIYVTPDKIPYEKIRSERKVAVAMLEISAPLRKEILANVPGFKTRIADGNIFLVK